MCSGLRSGVVAPTFWVMGPQGIRISIAYKTRVVAMAISDRDHSAMRTGDFRSLPCQVIFQEALGIEAQLEELE